MKIPQLLSHFRKAIALCFMSETHRGMSIVCQATIGVVRALETKSDFFLDSQSMEGNGHETAGRKSIALVCLLEQTYVCTMRKIKYCLRFE